MSSDADGRGDVHGQSLFLELTDETVRHAVEPETEEEEERLSKTTLVEEGVVVRTDDLRELRAALNGWVRLVSVAEDTERVER